MRYPLIGYQYAVDRIRRDCRLPDFNFRPKDLREWLAEAVRGLVAPGAFEIKQVHLPVVNHVAQLPTDWAGYPMQRLQFVRHYDTLRFKFSDGTACVRYYVMPLDNENMPMLIDIPDYLSYVHWFLCEKLCYLDDLPPRFTVEDCMVKSLNFKSSAETTLKWPTTAKSRNFDRRHAR